MDISFVQPILIFSWFFFVHDFFCILLRRRWLSRGVGLLDIGNYVYNMVR